MCRVPSSFSKARKRSSSCFVFWDLHPRPRSTSATPRPARKSGRSDAPSRGSAWWRDDWGSNRNSRRGRRSGTLRCTHHPPILRQSSQPCTEGVTAPFIWPRCVHFRTASLLSLRGHRPDLETEPPHQWTHAPPPLASPASRAVPPAFHGQAGLDPTLLASRVVENLLVAHLLQLLGLLPRGFALLVHAIDDDLGTLVGQYPLRVVHELVREVDGTRQVAALVVLP